MYSFAWPEMFNSAGANLYKDKEAIKSNLLLLLKSQLKTLFGDPGYGTKLKEIIFETNNYILRDIIIDELFSSIQTFMPQIFVTRNDIYITSYKTDVIAQINVTYKLDNTSDLYHINLTSDNTGEDNR